MDKRAKDEDQACILQQGSNRNRNDFSYHQSNYPFSLWSWNHKIPPSDMHATYPNNLGILNSISFDNFNP